MNNSFNAGFNCAECDTAPTLSNTIVLPLFFFLFSLAVPCITRDAINVRRALKLYDAQPTSPVPEPDVLTAEETRARSKANSGKQLANAAFGLLSYLSVLICGTFFGNPLTWEAVAQKSPSIILGVFLSHKRPFSAYLEGECSRYVRRTKPEVDGAHVGFPQILRLTTDKSKLPPMARRLMRIVWPAVLGFLTLGTGIMIPFFWVVHHFIGQTVSSTQVGPLKSVVKLYYSIISSATLSISFLLGLKILFGGSPSKHQEIPGNYPAIVAVAFSILFSVGICTTTVPVYHVLAKAHSYDLQILERNGDFEAEIAMPRGDLNEVDSNTEEMTVPVLKLDENGKRPVVVLGDFKVGKTLFASFWRSGPTKTGLGRKMPTLRLPTYSSAVIVLQTVTFLTLMAVIMAPYDTFDQHNPNMAWLHPISLRDIFREDVLKRMEAVSMFFFVTLIWTFGMFPLLTFTVLISVLWQHGRAGVKAIWTEDDRVWSEGPASSAVTPESEGDEEKASSVTAEPLLVDV